MRILAAMACRWHLTPLDASPRRDAVLPRMMAGWVRGSLERVAQTTAGLAQALALSPRQRSKGQINCSYAGNVQRGQRCGCACRGVIASALLPASSFTDEQSEHNASIHAPWTRPDSLLTRTVAASQKRARAEHKQLSTLRTAVRASPAARAPASRRSSPDISDPLGSARTRSTRETT